MSIIGDNWFLSLEYKVYNTIVFRFYKHVDHREERGRR